MNKVAKYLNEHLSGEVASQDFALSQVEVDNGLLARRPEMIVRAANMNDIRKVMRFCSQLAEKGHVLPVFVRGCGNDETGAATNKGIAIDEKTYMNRVIGIDPRQQLIHRPALRRCCTLPTVPTVRTALPYATGSVPRRSYGNSTPPCCGVG